MAVQNRLSAQKPAVAKKNEVVFMANGAQVTLTPETVKNYLVSGNKDRVTTQEVVMFMNLCRFNGLNPWLREAYCIKYGNEPATIVTSKDAFMKRAEACPEYDGYKAGVIIYDEETGDLIYRDGAIVMKNEVLAGAYAEVYRKDRSHPYRVEVSFDEYVGRKSDGTINGQWSKKPATMIRKVALVQALREAFPASLNGLFTAEESGNEEPIDVPFAEVPQEAPEEAQQETETTHDPAPEEAPQDDVANALFG